MKFKGSDELAGKLFKEWKDIYDINQILCTDLPKV